jgi:hypothetical protein
MVSARTALSAEYISPRCDLDCHSFHTLLLLERFREHFLLLLGLVVVDILRFGLSWP